MKGSGRGYGGQILQKFAASVRPRALDVHARTQLIETKGLNEQQNSTEAPA